MPTNCRYSQRRLARVEKLFLDVPNAQAGHSPGISCLNLEKPIRRDAFPQMCELTAYLLQKDKTAEWAAAHGVSANNWTEWLFYQRIFHPTCEVLKTKGFGKEVNTWITSNFAWNSIFSIS
mgnify:CR=1 FL=1